MDPIAERPRPHPLLLAAASVVAAAAIVIGLGLGDGGSTAPDPLPVTGTVAPDDLGPPTAGRPLPSVTLVSLTDDSTIDLAAEPGRPMVINFFASWCVPCIREMPDFERVHRELGDRVRFVGVNQGAQDRPEDARRIVEETGVTYETWRDDDNELFLGVGAFAMPTTLFVRGDGEILRLRGGAISADELRSLITDELLM